MGKAVLLHIHAAYSNQTPQAVSHMWWPTFCYQKWHIKLHRLSRGRLSQGLCPLGNGGNLPWSFFFVAERLWGVRWWGSCRRQQNPTWTRSRFSLGLQAEVCHAVARIICWHIFDIVFCIGSLSASCHRLVGLQNSSVRFTQHYSIKLATGEMFALL